MKPWLVLPVKSIALGKSRLAPHLSTSARRSLNAELLSRSLALAARFPGLDRTWVVSACTEVLEIARAQGARPLVEAAPGGLNRAVAQAVAQARAADDGDILVVSCDLPFAKDADLRRLVEHSRDMPGGITLASDREGSGTNALCIPAGAAFSFQFGPMSRQRHRDEASRRGLPFAALPLPGLAFDIDTIDDHAEWRRDATALPCLDRLSH